MLKYFLEIYHFYLFQGYKLQCAIENIDVHLFLTKDIWVLKGLISPQHIAGSTHSPLKHRPYYGMPWRLNFPGQNS
jgi:hypothetical protein